MDRIGTEILENKPYQQEDEEEKEIKREGPKYDLSQHRKVHGMPLLTSSGSKQHENEYPQQTESSKFNPQTEEQKGNYPTSTLSTYNRSNPQGLTNTE